ncbi:MAG: hypothetical protein ACK4Q5_08395 [Saprospiraceae bacterium]
MQHQQFHFTVGVSLFKLFNVLEVANCLIVNLLKPIDMRYFPLAMSFFPLAMRQVLQGMRRVPLAMSFFPKREPVLDGTFLIKSGL